MIKSIARKIVLPAIIAFGYEKKLFRQNKKRGCIINFHGVREKATETFNNRHIPVKEFEKIIKYLSENFSIVTLAELFEMHRLNKFPAKKTVALTFDDGYKNNFDVALPVLKKYNVPATFYIITRGLKERQFVVWPDKIDLLKKQKNSIVVLTEKFEAPDYYNVELKSELLNYVKTLGDKAIEITDSLDGVNEVVEETVKNASELIELVSAEELAGFKNESLLEFGSHTHSHYNLEYLDTALIRQELQHSKDILENIVGKKVISVAYPDGSYTSQINEIALEVGYKNLCVVDYKYQENNTNPNLLSRFTISNSTTFESNILRLAKQFDLYGF